jgi:opacity protein-like surface antigen
MNRIVLKSLILPALIGATVTVASADEEHFDIGVWNNAGTLTTGGWDHDTESLEVANLRVFEGTFGEDPAFPFATDEPGVGGAAADVGLELGGTFTLNIDAGLGQWNGNGFDTAAEELMNVDYGTEASTSSSPKTTTTTPSSASIPPVLRPWAPTSWS